MEIDLLSSGLYTVVPPEEPRADLPLHCYRVCVRRGPERHRFEMYPVPLSKRLPRMQVPREPDPDRVLDGQAVLDRCYDNNGGYADLVDCRRPPPTPLSPEEAAWGAVSCAAKGCGEDGIRINTDRGTDALFYPGLAPG